MYPRFRFFFFSLFPLRDIHIMQEQLLQTSYSLLFNIYLYKIFFAVIFSLSRMPYFHGCIDVELLLDRKILFILIFSIFVLTYSHLLLNRICTLLNLSARPYLIMDKNEST